MMLRLAFCLAEWPHRFWPQQTDPSPCHTLRSCEPWRQTACRGSLALLATRVGGEIMARVCRNMVP
jgi:hypothetical protein